MSDTTDTATETTDPPAGDYEALAAAFAPQNGGTGTDTGEEPADQQPPDDDDDEDDGNPNHEAAKWRSKFRDIETQRDALATRLEAMQRAAIDSQVAALGMKPAAVWAAGAKIEDLLDREGVPDVEKVEKAAAAAKDQLGITGPQRPSRGLSSGASAHEPPRNKWVEAFAPQDD